MAETKGRNLTGLIKYVKQAKPDIGLEKLLAACPNVASHYEQRINALRWYPLEAFLDPMERLAEMAGGALEEEYANLGRFGARRDVEGTYKVIFRSGVKLDPTESIKSCDLLWADSYRGAGEMKVAEMTEGEASIQILDFPDIRHSHCKMLEGWIDESANLASPDFTSAVTLESCPHDGGEAVLFRARWSTKES